MSSSYILNESDRVGKFGSVFMQNDVLLMATLSVASAVLPILLWTYGFEIADSGWAAVLTRDYFSRPEMVGNASPWFLTWAIGALVTEGSIFQLSALRAATFVPIFISALMTFITFYIHGFKSWGVSFSIFVAGVVSYAGFGEYFLNYNTVSACCAVSAFTLLLCSGSKSIKFSTCLAFCWLGGMCFVLSVLSRLASLTMALPCVYMLYALHRMDFAKYSTFVLGMISAVGIIGFYSWQTGHLPYIVSNLVEFTSTALISQQNASHNRSQLLVAFFSSLKYSSEYGALLFVTAAFLFERMELKKYIQLLFALFALAFLVWTERTSLFQLVPIMFVMLLTMNLDYRNNTYEQILAIIGALFAILFPLGSTNGFVNSCFALWFLLPGVVVVLSNTRDKLIAYTGLCVLLISGVFNSLENPYWDRGVYSLDCNIENKFIGVIKTTCARKEVIDDVVHEISKHVNEGDDIFVYQNSPMIYILTGTRPWIPYPWPFLISAIKIEQSIHSKEQQSLPKLIVRERLSPFGKQWPDTTQQTQETISGEIGHSVIYDQFIDNHAYRVVFQNKMFEVLSR